MSIELDHLIVPAHDRVAAAQQLASILNVPWAETGVGPFSPVYVSDSLTLDFDQVEAPFPILHFCFRVDDSTFADVVHRLRQALPTAAHHMVRSTIRSILNTVAALSTGVSRPGMFGKRSPSVMPEGVKSAFPSITQIPSFLHRQPQPAATGFS